MYCIQMKTAIGGNTARLRIFVGWVKELNPTYTFLFFRTNLRSIGIGGYQQATDEILRFREFNYQKNEVQRCLKKMSLLLHKSNHSNAL